MYFAVSYHNDDELSQDLNSHGGKVLRLRDDGTPAPGQSVHWPGRQASGDLDLGHRGIHGLAVHPQTGQLWIAEHGDELNIAKPGGNYGWPFFGIMGLGGGTPTPPAPRGVQVIGPYVSWNPAINLSGMTFYTGDRFPQWKGNIFLGRSARPAGASARAAGQCHAQPRRTALHADARDVVHPDWRHGPRHPAGA